MCAQELMRCALNGPDAACFLHSKHLLLAKLFRGGDRWTVHAAVEARNCSVRDTPKGSLAGTVRAHSKREKKTSKE